MTPMSIEHVEGIFEECCVLLLWLVDDDEDLNGLANCAEVDDVVDVSAAEDAVDDPVEFVEAPENNPLLS